ncbi:hypothetical protein PG990_006639 [Apiospora arundinis]|uniref:Uncharacterized protein n=1 Tax=Apiospora arundinis TaxID=335852 RepID=A0ABR2JB09_9PEZI
MALSSSISAFKATGSDLLVGSVDYATCDHEFAYISDHTLPRTGEARVCPQCTEGGGKCAICSEPWDANATESCPHCDMFFASELLEERVAKLKAEGLKVAQDSIGLVVARRVELERKAKRKERLLALKKSDTGEKDADESSKQQKE